MGLSFPAINVGVVGSECPNFKVMTQGLMGNQLAPNVHRNDWPPHLLNDLDIVQHKRVGALANDSLLRAGLTETPVRKRWRAFWAHEILESR